MDDASPTDAPLPDPDNVVTGNDGEEAPPRPEPPLAPGESDLADAWWAL